MDKAFLIPFYFLIFISLVHGTKCAPYNYNAIFSFGNSYADTGNFVILMNGVLPYDPFEQSPYGITYFGVPTGRACDGRLVLDFIAQNLGLPLVPPYSSKGQDFHQGANFATIGSTALELDYFRERNITNVPPVDTSCNVQLGWFDQLKPSLCNTTETCRTYLSNSLFLVGEFGGNDYIFVMSAGKSISEVKSYVPAVIATIIGAAESLLKQGAMNIILPGNVPTGCMPITLTLYGSSNKSDYDRLGCLKHYNSIALAHNTQLRKAVKQLQIKYPMARIRYADYYNWVIRFLQYPEYFGFTNGAPLRACCGGGGPYNYNLTAACGLPGASACSDPSTYINWDGIHLTEAAYKIIAAGWLRGHNAHQPILPGYSEYSTVASI